MELGALTYGAVTVLCYLAGLGLKASSRIPDAWIPLGMGLLGMLLGIACLYLGVPDFPARDPVNAACIGAASGLAATGIHQIGKQLQKQNAE